MDVKENPSYLFSKGTIINSELKETSTNSYFKFKMKIQNRKLKI